MATTQALKVPRGRSYRAAAVVLALAVPASLGLSACSSTRPSRPAPARGATAPPAPGTSSPATTTTATTTTEATTTTTTAPPTPPDLSVGSHGPAVLALQQRLTALGYWLGTPDGTFGDSTEQAVYALQKAAGIGRDGIVGPQTDAALSRGVVPRPRSTSGDVVEVDLGDDLLMIVKGGTLEYTLNTSTGGGYVYSDDGITAVADTPTGQFQIYRQVDGMVIDSLGELWRPKFFDDGFAIHGDSFVPPYPVSHGCVRISDEAIDWVWADGVMPIGTTVWVYP